MARRIRVDSSFSCRIRTASTRVTARGGVDPPQPVPATPMPGRKVLRIMNYGVFASPGQNIQLVIGDQGVRWEAGGPIEGFGLELYESVEIPVDDGVAVFALLDPGTLADADLRTFELA